MMSDIGLFEEFAAKILADLFTHFPVKMTLDARVIANDLTGMPSRAWFVARATLRCLIEEGIIMVRLTNTFGRYDDAVLTERGLMLMGYGEEPR